MPKGLPKGAEQLKRDRLYCTKCRPFELLERSIVKGFYGISYTVYTCIKCDRVWYKEECKQ